MNMMNEKIYQLIYDEISEFLPKGWKRAVIYLEYGEDSYSFSFFIKEKEQYIKCYDLTGVTEDELMNTFKRIDKAVLEERKKSTGNLWTNMTMVVTDDGSMHTDYDYTDLSENAYQYKKNWKKRYLI